MALDFPSSPTNGQTYSSGGRSWTWSNTTSSWNAANSVTSTQVTTALGYTPIAAGGVGSLINTEAGLGTWKYENKSLLTTTQTSAIDSIFFKSDGLELYLTTYGVGQIWQYTLGTAWDITTATFTRTTTSIASGMGLWFRPDGLKVYICLYATAYVYEYNLSTAWDISTISFSNLFVVSQDTTPEGLSFNATGTTMWILGNTNDTVYQYTLSTPWSVGTATYASKSLVLPSDQNLGLFVDSTSTYAYISGIATDTIYMYTMSTPGDISTATLTSQQNIGAVDAAVKGIWVEAAQNKAYLAGDINNRIYQMTTNLPGFIVSNTSKTAQVLGSLDVQNNFSVNGATRINGLVTLLGLVEASGQIYSYVASGTAPFSVASTTMVTNFNSNYLQGGTWANPGAIGGTTAWPGKFTSLTITGSLNANGSIGTAGQVLLSNGTLAYWGTVGITNKFVSTATTAVSGDIIGVDTTSAAINITLPATPVLNSIVTIYDAGCTASFGGFATNNCTVLRNGSTIQGGADDVLLTIKGMSVTFEYNGTTWRMRNGG